jgi:1-acyl-sn-glycerol-3-phosphate acyltransferase
LSAPPKPTALHWLRGLIFNIWMGGSALMIGLAYLPVIMIRQELALAAVRLWCRSTLAALRLVCGVRVELRGLDRLPASGVLIAAKHQGMLDTVAPFVYLSAPTIVLKKELLAIPVYGWYAHLSGMIAIDRDGAAKTLRGLVRAVRRRFEDGRQVLIFPEGTRMPPGATPDYKPGIAALYRELDVGCVPVATNSGLHWPAHGLARLPGKVVFEILEPIPAGLKRPEFMRLLEDRIETATRRLLAEDGWPG